MKKDKIHFIITGGTIDSFYNGKIDTVETLKKSTIPDFLGSLNLDVSFIFSQLFMKDSRQISMADRKRIINEIIKSPADKIIITHGTYTMPDTAKYLKANLKNNKKTIIITGSMIPLIGFSPSDAPFNLGFAIATAKAIDKGIFVCMNGRKFDPDEVIKYLNAGKFISIFNK